MTTIGNNLGYYNVDELRAGGLHVGRGSKIARSVELIGVENMLIGENVRIDGDVFISAGNEQVVIGSHSHIARGVHIFGAAAGVRIGRCVGISPKSTLMTASDMFHQDVLCVPNVSEIYRNVYEGPIGLADCAMIGAHGVIMPNVLMNAGAALGSNSLLSSK